MRIFLELPEIFYSNYSKVIESVRGWTEAIDGVFVPDLPLGKATLDLCAYYEELRDALQGAEIIPVQSVGHRSMAANKSRLQCLRLKGARRVLLVQGPQKCTKVSEILGYAVSRFTVGSVLSERTLESRIRAGVAFFVTQLFPDERDLSLAEGLGGRELYISVAVSDRAEDYLRLREMGFRVPPEILQGGDIREGLRSYIRRAEGIAGPAPGIYAVPLSRSADIGAFFENL
ncbi:MAG: hypothetical protein ACP5LW_03600 [Nitrososphaeria archaeon]